VLNLYSLRHSSSFFTAQSAQDGVVEYPTLDALNKRSMMEICVQKERSRFAAGISLFCGSILSCSALKSAARFGLSSSV